MTDTIYQTVVEQVQCILFDANLGKQFWAEATSTATCLINWFPCAGSVNTTEKLWTSISLELEIISIIGCKVMAHIPKKKVSKPTESITMRYSSTLN